MRNKDSIPYYTDSISAMFIEEIDTLVSRDIIRWAPIDNIYNQYLSWESSHPGMNPLTDTFTVSPGDTTYYSPPPGWTFFTEWDDSTAGIPILPNNIITSIAIDKYGKVWVGTHGGSAINDGAS